MRNLEWGLRYAARFGGAMPVGYLPDMFGHCAQMPQILALAGLRQACVWRGVPAAIDWHAFASAPLPWLSTDADWLELRVVAMTGEPTSVQMRPVGAARRADLLGHPGQAVSVHEGTATLPLRPWEIATIQLRRDPR